MQFLGRESCNFKIACVNQVRFSVRFVAAISQGFPGTAQGLGLGGKALDHSASPYGLLASWAIGPVARKAYGSNC